MQQSYKEIEKDLTLLGATAIEDKLQVGVPETIARLSDANIKIWVLTGDKLETAINIAYSCNLLTDKFKDVFIINSNNEADVSEDIKYVKSQMDENIRQGTDGNGYGLVVTGQALEYCLEPNNKPRFLHIADLCKSVVACRVTPIQKSDVVNLIKFKNKFNGEAAPVTLAIGDGANDVSMIKAAHIGVGISGEEGSQAQMASDFSFAQFRFLQRLLLVHGRWSYFRFGKFLNYFFYKNFVFTMVQFWYAWWNGFSAQTIYDEFFVTLYNVVFTSMPILIVGIFDQDVNDKVSIEKPNLYLPGQKSKFFNKSIFLMSITKAIITSAVIYFCCFGSLSGLNMKGTNGQDASDFQSLTIVLETCVIFVVTLQLALDTNYWTALNHFFLWGSVAMFFLFLFMMYSNTIYSVVPNTFLFVGVARNSYVLPQLWLIVLLATAICILPVLAFRYVKQVKYPSEAYKAKMDYKHWKAKDPSRTSNFNNAEETMMHPRQTHLRRTLTRQSQRRLKERMENMHYEKQNNNNLHEQQFINVDAEAPSPSTGYYERPNTTESTELRMGDLIMKGAVRRSTRRKVRQIKR